jgi:hypothetical protein
LPEEGLNASFDKETIRILEVMEKLPEEERQRNFPLHRKKSPAFLQGYLYSSTLSFMYHSKALIRKKEYYFFVLSSTIK